PRDREHVRGYGRRPSLDAGPRRDRPQCLRVARGSRRGGAAMRWMRFLTRRRAGCELGHSPSTPLPACARLALLGAVLVIVLGGLDRAAHAAEMVSLHGDAQSWEYLAHKLVADGIDADRVKEVLADPRFGAFTGLAFTLHPREPRAMYRGFLRSSSIARARAC